MGSDRFRCCALVVQRAPAIWRRNEHLRALFMSLIWSAWANCQINVSYSFAIAPCLLIACCAAANRPFRAERPPAVPIEISAGPSLIPSDPPLCEGAFTYRGVAYLVKVDGCAEGYKGAGTIQGLDRPESIVGDYTAQAGSNIWRNEHGVAIDVTPPIKSVNTHRHLRMYYSGANLPRQP
jgi:hypothetical protein